MQVLQCLTKYLLRATSPMTLFRALPTSVCFVTTSEWVAILVGEDATTLHMWVWWFVAYRAVGVPAATHECLRAVRGRFSGDVACFGTLYQPERWLRVITASGCRVDRPHDLVLPATTTRTELIAWRMLQRLPDTASYAELGALYHAAGQFLSLHVRCPEVGAAPTGIHDYVHSCMLEDHVYANQSNLACVINMVVLLYNVPFDRADVPRDVIAKWRSWMKAARTASWFVRGEMECFFPDVLRECEVKLA